MTRLEKNASLELLENALGYHFHNQDVLRTALTHSSAVDEGQPASNERLEFLGDSVLSLAISQHLFVHFAHLPEGGMTRIRAGVVSEVSLAEAAHKLELWRYMILGRALEVSGGRKQASVLADALESVIAAIFLDGGMQAAQPFVLHILDDHIQRAVRGESYRDYKTELQEWVQRDGDAAVKYVVEGSDGPDHRKTFFVHVSIQDRIEGSGKGRSKKEAEQEAARQACIRMIPSFSGGQT